MKTKVQAMSLQPGDKVGSGEIVLQTSQGVRTPPGKIEVVLAKEGKSRLAVWGKYTMINVERE